MQDRRHRRPSSVHRTLAPGCIWSIGFHGRIRHKFFDRHNTCGRGQRGVSTPSNSRHTLGRPKPVPPICADSRRGSYRIGIPAFAPPRSDPCFTVDKAALAIAPESAPLRTTQGTMIIQRPRSLRQSRHHGQHGSNLDFQPFKIRL